MSVLVRSVAGNSLTNDSTYQLNSPGTISIADRLVAIFCMNDNTVSSTVITPPSGWGLADELADSSVGDRGMRYIVYDKEADSIDAVNEGTANYYDWVQDSGEDSSLDLLYAIFSLYDDGAGAVTYRASSLADNVQLANTSGTAAAPTQTIGYDGSRVLCGWAARDATGSGNEFNIDAGESYSSPGVLHHGSFITNAQADLEWCVGSKEFDVADSPIGTQDLSHTAMNSDVDTYSISIIYEVASSSVVPAAMYHYRNHGKIF